MRSLIFLITTISTYFIVLNFSRLHAQTDASSQNAMRQTQELLKNKEEREKVAIDPKGKKVIQDIKTLTGGDKKSEEEIYGLAADLMPLLMEEAKGDPNKMMEILQEAQKDPEAFAKRWTPEQRKKLKGLADKLGTKPAPPPH